LRNSANENFHLSGKNGSNNFSVSFYVRSGGKTTKDHFNSGTDQITLIGSNADVVDFYAGLNEQDIESAGKVDINTAEMEELKSLPGIGEKTAEKIINKRNELGAFSLLEDLMLVHGIGQKTF
jgi:competence protein ComEA